MKKNEISTTQISPCNSVNDRKSIAIFVLGPSSSGKTTLCDALASNLNVDPARYIKEVARDVMRTHGFSRADTETFEMQSAIMTAQLQAEKQALRAVKHEADVLVLSDRSAVDPIVYAVTSKTASSAETSRRLLHDEEFQAILPLYRRSLFVVLQPIAEWVVDDGVRSLQDPWNYNEQLKSILDRLGISYVEIGRETMDLQERANLVKGYLSRRQKG